MGRGTLKIFCACRCAHKLVTVIGDRANLARRSIRGLLVPLAQWNLMGVGVGSGADGCVTCRRDKVGVIVVAVSKVRTLFQKQVPAILLLELGAIPIKIVPSKLIEYENNDKLWLGVICVAARSGCAERQER